MREHFLIGLTDTVELGVGANWLVLQLRLIFMILLLLAGFLAGPITGFVRPDELLGDLLLSLADNSNLEQRNQAEKSSKQELQTSWQVQYSSQILYRESNRMAEVTTVYTLARRESRGGHARDDFAEREDENWLKHTLCFRGGDRYRLNYKPVTLG